MLPYTCSAASCIVCQEAPTCRYGLETAESPAAEAEQEGGEAAEAHASQNGGGSGRRHLSAKERKLLKKVTVQQPTGALTGSHGNGSC